jgi:hypothetical protein
LKTQEKDGSWPATGTPVSSASNPARQQKVPPIHAQLHDSRGKVVYSWTIPPPARTIPPGGSASFNSAELNIPPTAQELTVTLGEPKA